MLAARPLPVMQPRRALTLWMPLPSTNVKVTAEFDGSRYVAHAITVQ